MNSHAQIAEVLPGLSDGELREVKRFLRAEHRRRHPELLYLNAHGDQTEEGQMAAAAQL